MSLLRHVCGLPSLHGSIPASTCVTVRSYTSFLNKLSDTVTAKVSKLAEDVWLGEDKLVTEPRRKIEPQHALTQSLAERLATQRNVKQRLVPTSIKVDKSRQYVEFTWPAEATAVMWQASLAEQATSPPEVTSNATDLNSGFSTATPTVPPRERSSSSFTGFPAALTGGAAVGEGPEMPLRTRALAEYLRAYTPSTDGALGAKDIVIYGRRGITISQVVPMGNYALRFVFSDQHSGGIYSYEYLFYLTGPATKYGLMRAYIRDLKQRRKSRDPPKRAPSKRHVKDCNGADSRRTRETRKPH